MFGFLGNFLSVAGKLIIIWRMPVEGTDQDKMTTDTLGGEKRRRSGDTRGQ
jgi:hypothetical protein